MLSTKRNVNGFCPGRCNLFSEFSSAACSNPRGKFQTSDSVVLPALAFKSNVI